jgi:hypothetical protein
MARIALLVLLVDVANFQVRDLQVAWTLTQNDLVRAAVWSPNGACIAVATDNTINVIDASGKQLWTWNFRRTNRYIRVRLYAFMGSTALSPRCDAVAIAGDASYKYVWAAHESGRHAFIQTDGSPERVAFDLRGETVAITTAAGRGYLLSTLLKTRWSGRLSDFPVRWPTQVRHSKSVQSTEFVRSDVDVLLSVPPWGLFVSDALSEDGEWRVVKNSPHRRTGDWSTFELWGPLSNGFHSRYGIVPARDQPRWSKGMGCLDVELTRDGMFVIASGDPNLPLQDAIRGTGCLLNQYPSYVFDRDGNLVLTWPGNGDRDKMSEAVFAKTGKRLVVQERVTFNDPDPFGPRTDDRHLQVGVGGATSPDGKMVLRSRDRDLRLYRAR